MFRVSRSHTALPQHLRVGLGYEPSRDARQSRRRIVWDVATAPGWDA